jgi:Putative DNA-binding domain
VPGGARAPGWGAGSLVTVPFPIDVSRAFRYPSELKRLAEAVHGAGDYDETRWIEWKSTLDLQSSGGIHHIARQVLGFANRDPQSAAVWADGNAYLVIGVSPGQYSGVTLIDPERLVSQIQPYVGADITWTPESIEVGGVDVLVVVVEPPRPGDPIHVLRKDLPPYRKGTVLIRRHGQVVQADDDEMAMLQRRLLARAAQIAVAVDPAVPAIETQPDFKGLLDSWAERERTSRLAARDEAADDEEPVSVIGMFSAGLSRDPRSVEQYARQIDTYLTECRDPQLQRAIWHFARHRPAMLALRMTNSSERNYTQVRVIAEIDNDAVLGFEKNLLKAIDDDLPRLPPPPSPLGTPMGGRSTGLSGFGLGHLPQLRYNAVPRPLRALGRSWQVRTIAKGIQHIEFDPCDLRPHETIELTPVPLIVHAASGAAISVEWAATATNADGKLGGSIALSVSDSSFGDSWLN